MLYFIGIIGVVIYLLNYDFVSLPKIENYTYLTLSVFLVLIGFIVESISWYYIVRSSHSVNFLDAFVSSGISVFGKYVPGKIWVIIGRAGYISKKYGYSLASLSSLSLHSQLIGLFTATVLALLGICIFNIFSSYINSILLGMLFLSFLIFIPGINKLVEKIVFFAFKKSLNFSEMRLVTVFWACLLTSIYWLLWATGFHFLVLSVSTTTSYGNPFFLGFIIAALAGILAIFSPGGIGIREGVLTFFLVNLGIKHELALGLALASRIWFLLGEAMMFLSAAVVSRLYPNSNN